MSAATAGMVSLLGLDPATYVPHALHAGDRTYTETNCYTRHPHRAAPRARRRAPRGGRASRVRMDFEGDQWTFFKPPPEDLERLFGIDIHEMQPYRPLPEQIAEQLARGRTMHRRARLLVPAGHGVDQLPQRARQDAR